MPELKDKELNEVSGGQFPSVNMPFPQGSDGNMVTGFKPEDVGAENDGFYFDSDD